MACKGMARIDEFDQARGIDMGVDLRGRYIGVSEQGL
jgi:hypothetical protein